MSFSFHDAIAHFRALDDTGHKFWGYQQAVVAAAAAFAWTGDAPRSTRLSILATIAFVVFALGNFSLVLRTQTQIVATANAIKDYFSKHPGTVDEEFHEIIRLIDPDSVAFVASWHLVLSIGVVFAIWIRPWLE